jgi:hypothetical protein
MRIGQQFTLKRYQKLLEREIQVKIQFIFSLTKGEKKENVIMHIKVAPYFYDTRQNRIPLNQYASGKNLSRNVWELV